MATGQGKLVSQFPPPPHYYKNYTNENKDSYSEPPKPIEGEYMMFGQLYSTAEVLPTLEEANVPKLYEGEDSNLDHKQELKKLNSSLIKVFKELINVLIEKPEDYKEKVEEIRNILINLHYLINLYRPHQARQTLISIMEEQILNRREFVDQIQK